MLATRVTLALNAKQSQKAPLVIPASAAQDPSTPTSIRSLVLRAAQSKLRLKKPSRIFVAGTGQELLTEADWKAAVVDDVTLLVSAGEEYVGLKREFCSTHPDINPNCPVNILAKKAPVDQISITQVKTTARNLPGLIHAVGQPDLHPGTKFPIGAVFVSQKWVHPPLIGSDIGCGMAWYRTNLLRSQVDGDKGRKVAERLRGLEGPWRMQSEREQWLNDEHDSCSAGEEWDSSLGTIGAGNHFAEIQVVEEAMAVEEDGPGLRQDEVILLVHSGSRGYGGSILRKYASDSRDSLEEGTDKMKGYMRDHDQACRWAKANRDLIALRILTCLEPGNEEWMLGHNDDDTTTDAERIAYAKSRVRRRKVVDIWHNHVERVKWPPMRPPSRLLTPDLGENISKLSLQSNHDADHDYAYIHRKGAAPTYDPSSNLPLSILPLPGSRGTPTIILKPLFSAETGWGKHNAVSVAHGAGRSMSRAKALASLSQKYNKNATMLLEPSSSSAGQSQSRVGEDRGRHVHGGTWVICDEKDLVYEEAPEAYKDVYAVAEDLVQAGAARVVGWCRARVSYKVRNGEPRERERW